MTGIFKVRKPPKSTWISQNAEDRPSNTIITGKGLRPILRVNEKDAVNIVVPDIMLIGGIDNLRERKNQYEAVMMANTHIDFQGKRILVLLLLDRTLKLDEIKIMMKIARSKHGKNKRVTKWSTYCVNNIIYALDIISKDEFEVLEKLRKLSNKLRHNQIAMFKMKSSEVDQLLYQTIQVLMRMIELPVPLTKYIDGYKHKFFWKDMGYY